MRGENRKLTDDEQNYIEEIVEKIMQQHEDARMAYILDQEVSQDGLTAKVSTKILAESLAREIKGQTSGKLSVAFEHKTTSRDGTEVYTNTYLVRLPEFAPDDIVEYQNTLWVIKNVSDQQISMISLESHEIKKIDRKRVENRAKRKNDEIVSREYMFVSSDGQTAVIMGMDNYENFDDNVERIPPGKEEGETIQGFIFDDKNYYIK